MLYSLLYLGMCIQSVCDCMYVLCRNIEYISNLFTRFPAEGTVSPVMCCRLAIISLGTRHPVSPGVFAYSAVISCAELLHQTVTLPAAVIKRY